MSCNGRQLPVGADWETPTITFQRVVDGVATDYPLPAGTTIRHRVITDDQPPSALTPWQPENNTGVAMKFNIVRAVTATVTNLTQGAKWEVEVTDGSTGLVFKKYWENLHVLATAPDI